MIKTFLALAAAAAFFGPSLLVAGQPAGLGGRKFNITVILAKGFVERSEDGQWSGYVIDMIDTVAKAADFSYELFTPSGYGSGCPSPLVADTATPEDAYSDSVTSAYLCGQGDTLDDAVPDEYKTDMYWSMYFVTTGRQLAGKFSLPFKPPFGGLTMYGTATGIQRVEDLILQQKNGQQGPACVGENTAYGNFLATSLPDLQTVAIANTDDAAQAALRDGTCDVLINAEHAAVAFVKTSSESDQCLASGKPVGIIGEGLKFGLTQMAVGISNGIDEETILAINYYLNTYMTCAPGSAEGACETSGSFYESWIRYAGTGIECGYGSAAAATDEGTEGGDMEEEGDAVLEEQVEESPEEGSGSGARRLTSFVLGGLGHFLRTFG